MDGILEINFFLCKNNDFATEARRHRVHGAKKVFPLDKEAISHKVWNMDNLARKLFTEEERPAGAKPK